MQRITKDAMRRIIASDLAWIRANDGNLWASWSAVDADYPDDEEVEVSAKGDETLYCIPSADFALAVYGQSEPRFASWALEPER